MGSPSIVAFALTSAASSLTSDDKQNESSYPLKSRSLVAGPSESLHVPNTAPPLNGWQQNHLQFYPRSSIAQPYLYTGGNGFVPVPYDHTSGQDTRNVSGLLDRRQWSPLSSCAPPPGTHFPSMFMESHASLHVVSNGSFTSDATPARGMVPEPYSQALPDLGSGFSNPMRYRCGSPGTDVSVHQLDYPTFFTSHVLASSSSSASAGDLTNFVSDERQTPIVIYRPTEKRSSGHRHCQRACAINIEGLWIDKDDLYSGTGQDMISVHECQWAKSSNPCGMWIIGSRSRVGAHIRKWHRQRHADSTVNCLWGGCTTSKAMLKDSINRHVVTVHLGEGFHCQGCDQKFSRKDVYDKHVESGEVCRDAGAAIVYGIERRVIDTRQALQRGGHGVRYAGR